MRDGAAHELAITLLRSTGMLSQGPMPTRPLPAGPLTPIEGAQLQRVVTSRYAVTVGDVDPYAVADHVLVPLLVDQEGPAQPAPAGDDTAGGAPLGHAADRDRGRGERGAARGVHAAAAGVQPVGRARHRGGGGPARLGRRPAGSPGRPHSREPSSCARGRSPPWRSPSRRGGSAHVGAGAVAARRVGGVRRRRRLPGRPGRARRRAAPGAGRRTGSPTPGPPQHVERHPPDVLEVAVAHRAHHVARRRRPAARRARG